MKKLTEEIPENTGNKSNEFQDISKPSEKVYEEKNSETIIDATKDQKTVEPKKDNTWIWALVALLVTVLIAYLINKKNEETN